MIFLQTLEKFLAFRMIAEEQGSRFGKGPREVRSTDFLA
jgi:hypothetical protein